MRCGSACGPDSIAESSSFARPKSRIFTLSSLVTITFDGFKSR